MGKKSFAGICILAILLIAVGCAGNDAGSSSASGSVTSISSLDDFYSTELTKDLDIRDLSEDYSTEDAQTDGYFVIGAMVHNDHLYTEFMEKYKGKETAFIRVAQNTVEGDLILYDVLYYQPSDKVYVVTDDTRDEFASDSDRKIQMEEYGSIGEYEYDGGLYWVAYNGEINDEAMESGSAFVLATIN